MPLEGAYEAELWPVPNASYKFAPVALTVSVDRSGRISGSADWTLPDSGKDRQFLGGIAGGYWKTRFTVAGRLDKVSGPEAVNGSTVTSIGALVGLKTVSHSHRRSPASR